MPKDKKDPNPKKKAKKLLRKQALDRAQSILYEHFDADAVVILISKRKGKLTGAKVRASGNYWACIGLAKEYLRQKGE